MNLTRTFYDGEKIIELKDVGLGDIQAYILEKFDGLFHSAKRKYSNQDLGKIKLALENKILTKKELDIIIKKFIDEESFCKWKIEK